MEQGWWPLLVRLDTRLRAIVPDYAIRNVQPRNGHLQFVFDPLSIANAPSAFTEAIHQAVAESKRTCEVCGQPGRMIIHPGGFVAVLCNDDGGHETDPTCSTPRGPRT